MYRINVLLYCIILVWMSSLEGSFSSSLDKELTLTLHQKRILDKFRNDVSPNLPHDYMKTEIYLIKWLREAKFNLNEAARLLNNNLIWRAENKIDGVIFEEFSQYEKEFPSYLDGTDYEDRPVGTVDVSEWDPRRVLISGEGEKFMRYLIKSTEMGSVIVRDRQTAGFNVTQFTLIANLDGFNLIQHGCLRCITFYINYILMYQNYYPGQVYKLFLINTPASFDFVMRIVYPVLTQEVKDTLSIHGLNKQKWQKAILDIVPADQLRTQFGGTKPTDEE